MTDRSRTSWVVIGLCLAVVPAPLANAADKPKLATATFAGGCFWCMEKPFEDLPGVKSVISGYSGGKESKPTYEDVSAGKTGHTESVQVTYDPTKVTYAQLLQAFDLLQGAARHPGQLQQELEAIGIEAHVLVEDG